MDKESHGMPLKIGDRVTMLSRGIYYVIINWVPSFTFARFVFPELPVMNVKIFLKSLTPFLSIIGSAILVNADVSGTAENFNRRSLAETESSFLKTVLISKKVLVTRNENKQTFAVHADVFHTLISRSSNEMLVCFLSTYLRERSNVEILHCELLHTRFLTV